MSGDDAPAEMSALAPSTQTPAPVRNAVPMREGDVLGDVLGGACLGSRSNPSWRAVGWSKTSVLGSELPAAVCSWLRSSTAPSESTPDSISGASASTAPPAVRCTISSTDSRERTHDAEDAPPSLTATASRVLGANAERKAGVAAPSLRVRLQVTGTKLITQGAPGRTAVANALRPCAGSMRANPEAASIAAIRSLAAPRVAMPTSAHAPH